MIDPGAAVDAVETLGFPVAVALFAIGLAVAALWYQRRQHEAELKRMAEAYVAMRAEMEHRIVDHQTAGSAWKQLYERANEERQENGREVAEQLKTLALAIELIHRRRES
jgi:type II secretory pathway pseudopilin PulG